MIIGSFMLSFALPLACRPPDTARSEPDTDFWYGDTGEVPCTSQAGLCPGGTFTIDAGGEQTLGPPVPVPSVPGAVTVGDLAGTGVPQVYVGTATTVTRLDEDGGTTDLWVKLDDGTAAFPLVADLTGDGVDDLAIGFPVNGDGAGQVFVFPGPVTDPVDDDTPHLVLEGHGDTYAGSGLWAAETDGDGVLDLVVRGNGVAWVRPGPIVGEEALGGAGDATWQTPGFPSIALGDVDADGIADLVFTLSADSQDEDCLVSGSGVFVSLGPSSPGTHDLDDVPMRLALPAGADAYLPAVLGDADGDARTDVIVAGVDLSDWETPRPEAWLYDGPPADGVAPSATFGVLGKPVGVADFDGDEVPDLLVGDMEFAVNYLGLGWVASSPSVLAGPLADRAPFDATCATDVAETWTADLGWGQMQASWFGDIDGNGEADVVIVGLDAYGAGLVWVVTR